MILSHPATSRQNGTPVESNLSADVFLAWAHKLHGNGWHPIPIGREVKGKSGKAPWLKHQIGFDGEDADPYEFELWPDRIESMIKSGCKGILSLGSRMPAGVIGIDVDHGYTDSHGRAKRGMHTLAWFESLWGPLPPTYIITARPYKSGSGIRLFRVDADNWRWPGDLETPDGGGDVEIIDRHHRLIVVPPSMHHTGAPYRLYGPDGDEVEPGILPPIDDLPELP
jgi:Bifunctional DNA primase/polymerase, N-terminal